MALDLGAQGLPILGKAFDENHALGIADIEDRNLLLAALERDAAADLARVEDRRAHVHLEPESAALPAQQTQMLRASAGDGW